MFLLFFSLLVYPDYGAFWKRAFLETDLEEAVPRTSVLTQGVDGAAGVLPSVEQAGFADPQSEHTLAILHQELWVLSDDHVVLHPDDLWLRKHHQEECQESRIVL